MAPADTDPRGASVLVVDDDVMSRRILVHMLNQQGHEPTPVDNGPDALELLAEEQFDIVLLDVRMPGMDGIEVCRRIRQMPDREALPILMITAEGPDEKLTALEAGADDFLVKPFDRGEFLARLRSLLRIRRYHEAIAEWNRTLQDRVDEQLRQIDRLDRLRRFLPAPVADLLVSSGDETFLEAHRRFIAVCFCDLRRFTAFSESAEPEELMAVLDEFYGSVGAVVRRFEATVGHLGGDSVMAYFNDPMPCERPEVRAAEMALAIREALSEPAARWRLLGHDLGIGMGVAAGYATLGLAGFEGRYEYTALGAVVNLASRLCDEAQPGQILISRRVHSAIEGGFVVEVLGQAELKGLQRPTPVVNLLHAVEAAPDPTERSHVPASD